MDLSLWQMFDQTPFQVLPPVLWWRSFPCPPRIVTCYASWYSHGQPVREQLKGHLWPWAVACPAQENLLCPDPLTLSQEWRTPALTSSLAPWAKRIQPPARLCGASPGTSLQTLKSLNIAEFLMLIPVQPREAGKKVLYLFLDPNRAKTLRTASGEVDGRSRERHPHPSSRILSHSVYTKPSVSMHLC